MNRDLIIRTAKETDAEELLAIYAPYVTDTAITFEYEIPSVEEFSRRIRNTLQKYPYLTAAEDGRIVGYAYASAYKDRAAYDWAVETSIYLQQDQRGKGIGKKLYLALEHLLKRQNIINLNACISYAPNADLHLNNASMRFHERLGYRKMAHFTKCGYKFGTWYDMIWMEKFLGEHPSCPAPVLPFSKLTGE
jgi:phosphinothricin acetyltransferase